MRERATKGIIVTSSYLTRGALREIEMQEYCLGKKDFDDVMAWIRGKPNKGIKRGKQ
jgi:restriction system protein